ncbi:MAG: Thymidylate synthase [Parcubacteria group bacterium GW2011_GWA2_47_8]|nr:MAG: Thymidylate synthase [Parcubacteria group bacterium GW2011_GWA2_47_8]
MNQYLELLQTTLEQGVLSDDRTGVGTIRYPGPQLRVDLSKGFPLLTTKKMFYKAIFYELLWMLRGDTNIKYLVDNGVNIWNEWPFAVYVRENKLEKKLPRYTDEWRAEMSRFIEQIKNNPDFAQKWGDLGPVYGKQWRRWETASGGVIDQLVDVIDQIKHNPTSRRIIVNGWNVGDIFEQIHDPDAAPPPCHTMYQFIALGDRLYCKLYQRSADAFLGVPFNIASYSLLTMIIAKLTDYKPGEFIHTFGDFHIYKNHVEQIREQLSRKPRALPKLFIHGKQKKLEDFQYDDFELIGYDPHPAIKAPIAV